MLLLSSRNCPAGGALASPAGPARRAANPVLAAAVIRYSGEPGADWQAAGCGLWGAGGHDYSSRSATLHHPGDRLPGLRGQEMGARHREAAYWRAAEVRPHSVGRRGPLVPAGGRRRSVPGVPASPADGDGGWRRGRDTGTCCGIAAGRERLQRPAERRAHTPGGHLRCRHRRRPPRRRLEAAAPRPRGQRGGRYRHIPWQVER